MSFILILCVKRILFEALLSITFLGLKKFQFKKKKEQKPDIVQDQEYENNESLKSNMI
jgi:hypothetical protein